MDIILQIINKKYEFIKYTAKEPTKLYLGTIQYNELSNHLWDKDYTLQPVTGNESTRTIYRDMSIYKVDSYDYLECGY